MTITWNIILQAIGFIIQGLNTVTIPPKYQLALALVVGGLQGISAGIAHYYNPDGSSAKDAYVKKAAAVLLLVLLCGTAGMAQANPVSLFSVSTQAVAMRIGGETVAGTDAIGSFNLTKTLFLQSDNMLAPANNFQGYFGGVKWYAGFLTKPLAKTTLSGISPYFHAALGIVRNVPANGLAQQHYGALVGTGFDYNVNGTFSFGPRIEYLNAPGFGSSPNGMAVSANLTVVLAHKH